MNEGMIAFILFWPAFYAMLLAEVLAFVGIAVAIYKLSKLLKRAKRRRASTP